MPSIISQTPDLFELKNPDGQDNDPPTLLVEVGAWKDEKGVQQSGVSVAVYGALAPLLSAGDARKFAKWLLKAADELEGAGKTPERKGQKKRRDFEDDE
jgi:hypothetical protein